jgi:hypothetical protein
VRYFEHWKKIISVLDTLPSKNIIQNWWRNKSLP